MLYASALFIRLSAIGDIVMSSPIIATLRARYPEAHIAWLVQPECAALLEANEQLDEVIIWPRSRWRELWRNNKWLTLWREIRSFRAHLRARKFDLAIDIQGLLKSGVWAFMSGAKQRIGLGSHEGSQHLMTRVLDRGDDGERIGSEYLHLARQLEWPVDDFSMRVALTDADRAMAGNFIKEHKLSQGYTVICPFTTRPQKHWLETRWIDLISAVNKQLALPVLILGGPGDKQAAARLQQRSAGKLVDAVGKTSLREAAALIHQASLLVGVDTGLTHMGIACNTPTLALFGSTVPYLNTTHDNAQVIYHQLECSPCRRRPTCNGEFTCMRLITVEEIMTSARQVMSVGQSS